MNFVKKISLKPSLRSFSLINNARFLRLNKKTLLSNNFNRFYSNVESSSSEKPNSQQNLKSSLEHDDSKLEITPIRLKDWDPKTKDKPDYEGRLSLALKGLKVISISSLMVTTFGAPMLYFANQTTPIVVKLIASSVVMAFGFFTTGFLHFCAGPYVHKIWLVNKDTAVAQTMAYLGKKQFWKFQHKDLKQPNPNDFRPWVTHTIFSKTPKLKQQLYIHPEDLPTSLKPLFTDNDKADEK